MPILPKARTQAEVAAILTLLEDASNAGTHAECRTILATATKRLKRHGERLESAASKIGAKGGSKTAERGPEYFRQIAAMRKTRGGGRPRKEQ